HDWEGVHTHTPTQIDRLNERGVIDRNSFDREELNNDGGDVDGKNDGGDSGDGGDDDVRDDMR
ncbi:hypothetical protein LOAG_08509, partial [Loa loa]